MRTLRPPSSIDASSAAPRALLCFLSVLLLLPVPVFAGTARVSGTIYTIDKQQIQTVWPNARVTLKNTRSGRELTVVSSDLGQYLFTGILPGEYELTVSLAGFERATKQITLSSEVPSVVDFQLAVQKQSESVNVSANQTGIDTSSSSGGTPSLTTNTLKSVSRLNSDFQDALPLLPGVLRGPDGLIHIKGGNANQSNDLINNASIGDPFTGQPALRLPNAAVESMRVLSNPFSAEFGGFSSGVVEVTTRGGGDEWKWLFEDPIPRLRWIDYSTHGIESATPHLAFSGPLIKGKLYLFQSLYYGYDTIRTPSLPNPNNIRIDERVNTQTQLDWDINAKHRLTGILTLAPENTTYANIDTFDPQPVTANHNQRGSFSSLADRWILPDGGFVQSLFSVKQLNSIVFPAHFQFGMMTLYPEQNFGSYFQSEHRDTWRYQWAQALHLRPLQFVGRHLFTVGYAFVRSTYDGWMADLPVNVLREDHTLANEITYGPLLHSAASQNNFTVFAQDNWQLTSRFTLDLGVRFEHDSLSSESLNAAPRLGFLLALTKDNRTVLRGGVGLFYDKIPLNVAVFPKFPAQTIRLFAADGVTVVQPPTTYTHVIATPSGTFRLPYSLGATVQLDRQLRRNLLVRLGYEQRQGYREFFVNPVSCTAQRLAQLQLLNSGGQRYQEFLAMLRWQPSERTTLLASYVRSRARGELNDYNEFFGNFGYPLIRPNQYGPLASDAPNRVLLWSVLGLPYKLQFVPIFDGHTGFPYSQLDQNWNYVGQRNEAGRFPTFASLDLKVQYPFDFKFRGHRIQFLGGLKVIDVTNHYNPRDVQQYLGSPNYGVFYNSVGRLWRIDGDFDF
jgi:Carboxypeptidase regulatory-like domain/TonB dependent receptor-like, beta-barrel